MHPKVLLVDDSATILMMERMILSIDESIVENERVAEAKATGATWPSARHCDVTACIPLRIDGVDIGFIAIRELLGHKNGLQPPDLELFALLGTQAAMALSTSTHQERRPSEAACN